MQPKPPPVSRTPVIELPTTSSTRTPRLPDAELTLIRPFQPAESSSQDTHTSHFQGAAQRPVGETLPPSIVFSDTSALQPQNSGPGTGLSSYLLNHAMTIRFQRAAPNDDGLHYLVNRAFAELEGGGVVPVEFDAQLGAYRATDLLWKLPPGPALYRNTGEMTWSPARAKRPGSDLQPEETLPAKKTARDESQDDESDNESVSSNSSSEDYDDYDDSTLLKLNDYQSEVILPPGGYFNSRGMIERTDIKKLYRVESRERVAQRGDPTSEGFAVSDRFLGVDKMMDEDVIITSLTREGAEHYGKTEFEDYELFEIDSMGVPAVSYRENVMFNDKFTSLRSGFDEDYIKITKEDGDLSDLGEGAYDFDEVHVSWSRIDRRRIKSLVPAP